MTSFWWVPPGTSPTLVLCCSSDVCLNRETPHDTLGLKVTGVNVSNGGGRRAGKWMTWRTGWIGECESQMTDSRKKQKIDDVKANVNRPIVIKTSWIVPWYPTGGTSTMSIVVCVTMVIVVPWCDVSNPHRNNRICCLLWIKKARSKDKTDVWVSVRWKTKDICCLLWIKKARSKDKTDVWVSVRWKVSHLFLIHNKQHIKQTDIDLLYTVLILNPKLKMRNLHVSHTLGYSGNWNT